VTAGAVAPPRTSRSPGTPRTPGTQYRQPPPPRTTLAKKVRTATPLLVILVAQAALSLRFVRSVGIDYGDETIYLYSGHQLVYELLHGGGSPYYETWFSGTPVLYPLLAAALDHVGGIVLVREFSLACMLGATTFLYLTARRIFGHWPGLTAAGLFAALGITQRMGVVATFDAPSLLCLAAAGYAAVRGAVSTRWLLMVPMLLFAANVLKYASVIFDPVVIGLAALQLREYGWRRVAHRVAALAAAAAILDAVAVFLAGQAYWQGIVFTTLDRQAGAQSMFGLAGTMSARSVVGASWSWIGAVVVMASAALIVTLLHRGERANFWLLTLLLLAGFLVTVEGIRLHTDQSMMKHDDFGIWFTCIAAGYALARGAELFRRQIFRLPVIMIASSLVAWTALHYVRAPGEGSVPSVTIAIQSQPLTVATQQYQFLAAWVHDDPSGQYLLGGLASYQTLYSDHLSVPWWQWADDIYIKYPIPGRGGDWHGQARGLECGGPGHPPASAPGCMYLEGVPGYEAAIHAHAFAIVSLFGNHNMNSQDRDILAAVESTPGYAQVSDEGSAPTFIYAPDYPAWERANPAAAAAAEAPPGG
jgi:Dolichyl-phosphate-mannose-protein mannosyltransferase